MVKGERLTYLQNWVEDYALPASDEVLKESCLTALSCAQAL